MSEQMLAEVDIAPIDTLSIVNNEKMAFGTHCLLEPSLLKKPADIPLDHVAYNPSAIWTVSGETGTHDIMYVRVEPNRSDSNSSHLGKSVVRPYIVDPRNPEAPLLPYPEAMELVGEDPALTRINRSVDGKLEAVWLLSLVDPKPKADRPNEVESLFTRFYIGASLDQLEHIADGPEWMKDIRIAKADGPLGTEISVYGRPQTQGDSGNITYTKLTSINELTAAAIATAPYIDRDLLPIGSGVWGGVNDVVNVAPGRNLLLAHRAWRTGPEGHGRHYESVLYGHNTSTGSIVELGVIATADKFPKGQVKDDTSVDLSDVVFPGGGYNGGLEYMSFGIRDGGLGISKVFQS